mmetsp:Transcript_86935/g.243642  ORF Transcript_86935/g.243642 Transcript_86935/m.243642 type:complete len:242 (+) Transcript_86935:354-1079(+)
MCETQPTLWSSSSFSQGELLWSYVREVAMGVNTDKASRSVASSCSTDGSQRSGTTEFICNCWRCKRRACTKGLLVAVSLTTPSLMPRANNRKSCKDWFGIWKYLTSGWRGEQLKASTCCCFSSRSSSLASSGASLSARGSGQRTMPRREILKSSVLLVLGQCSLMEPLGPFRPIKRAERMSWFCCLDLCVSPFGVEDDDAAGVDGGDSAPCIMPEPEADRLYCVALRPVVSMSSSRSKPHR